MYARMYVSLSVLVECIAACVRARLCVSARACARERRERRRNTRARPLGVYHHVGLHMWACMCVHMGVRADSMQVCVYVCVRARGGSGARARPRDVHMCIYKDTCITIL